MSPLTPGILAMLLFAAAWEQRAQPAESPSPSFEVRARRPTVTPAPPPVKPFQKVTGGLIVETLEKVTVRIGLSSWEFWFFFTRGPADETVDFLESCVDPAGELEGVQGLP